MHSKIRANKDLRCHIVRLTYKPNGIQDGVSDKTLCGRPNKAGPTPNIAYLERSGIYTGGGRPNAGMCKACLKALAKEKAAR